MSGVKNADENELKSIASPPEDTHVYNVADFSVMSDIVEGLAKTLCDQVENQDKRIRGLSAAQTVEPSSGSPHPSVITFFVTRGSSCPSAPRCFSPP